MLCKKLVVGAALGMLGTSTVAGMRVAVKTKADTPDMVTCHGPAPKTNCGKAANVRTHGDCGSTDEKYGGIFSGCCMELERNFNPKGEFENLGPVSPDNHQAKLEEVTKNCCKAKDQGANPQPDLGANKKDDDSKKGSTSC